MTNWEALEAIEKTAANGQLDAISENDRAWFAANPGREYRVRLPLAGEYFGPEPPVGFSIVLVWRVGRGVRARRRLDCYLNPPFSYVDPSGVEWEITRDAVRRECERTEP
jgi:hypothetical protein